MGRVILCTSLLLGLLPAFTIEKGKKPKLPDEFVAVPGGTYSLLSDSNGIINEMHQKIISVQSFYISKYEVTNLQYRQFYNEILPELTDSEKEKIVCDTAGWRSQVAYCEPMILNYYRHAAYNDYPVVNISYEGAMKYCNWLRQKIEKDNPDFVVEVKLPVRFEWIWAAMGGRSQAMFPWGKYYLLDKKGEPMCNFKRVYDGAVYRNRKTGKPEIAESNTSWNGKSYFTTAVKSYYPNDYGLYNMCGNAAEMIAEKGISMGGSWNDYGADVQIRAEAVYEKSAPTVGFRPMIRLTEKKQSN